MATKMKCAAQVWPNDRWPHSHPCRRVASVERDGKWWCKTHDPKAVAARSQAQADKYNAETQTVAERYRRAAAYTELVTALEALIEEVDRDQRSDGWSTPAREDARALLLRLKGG